MEKSKKKIITHDGTFHTDDVFATATLSLLLEKRGETFEVIRTREENLIQQGDFVYDIGGIYDEHQNKFDHHQKGGAGARFNGIEYSSFGLVWKKFGLELTRDKEVRDMLDAKLVAPIDADDNGVNIFEMKYDILPYTVQNIIVSMRPTWKEDSSILNGRFQECVEMAKWIIKKEIALGEAEADAKKIVLEAYQKSKDKRIIFLEKNFSHYDIFSEFEEAYFIIYPRSDGASYGVKVLRKNSKEFENKINFPASWAGLRDQDLANETGVKDAIFCHRALFFVVAKSKEGAIKLAELALSV